MKIKHPLAVNEIEYIELTLDCEQLQKEVIRITRLFWGEVPQYDMRRRPGYIHYFIMALIFNKIPQFKAYTNSVIPEVADNEYLQILIARRDIKRVFATAPQRGKVKVQLINLRGKADLLDDSDDEYFEKAHSEPIDHTPVFFQRLENDRHLWCFNIPTLSTKKD